MITILVAVYNGEKYLADQIESILVQTVKEWKLIIQDDCSSDETACIAKRYADKYPDRIRIIRRKTPSGSAKSNFHSMIKHVDTAYVMTCDQDDVWLPDKIEITLKKMNELEKKVGQDTPILVHTDLKVVDSQLGILSDSLFKYQKLDKNRDKLNNLLIQNIVTGCTLMANRILVKKAQQLPPNAIMHDWWLALTAAAFGCIGFVDIPTVLYRQHMENEIGAKDAGSLSYLLKRGVSILNTPQNEKQLLLATYNQAESFYETFRNDLTEDNLRMIAAFISIPNVSKLRRIRIISKYDFWKSGFFRKMGQLILS